MARDLLNPVVPPAKTASRADDVEDVFERIKRLADELTFLLKVRLDAERVESGGNIGAKFREQVSGGGCNLDIPTYLELKGSCLLALEQI